jgi:hypothetical protein
MSQIGMKVQILKRPVFCRERVELKATVEKAGSKPPMDVPEQPRNSREVTYLGNQGEVKTRFAR